MATSFLDELYFILMFPIILLCVDSSGLWEMSGVSSGVSKSLIWFAVGGYSIKLVYLLILSYGLLKNPRGLKYLLMKCFKLKLLRKWRHSANEAGSDIIRDSYELRHMPFSFLAEDFRSHFLFMDGTVLGSECDLNGLFCIEGYGLGDSISDFCPATDYVDHDADQSDLGRKRVLPNPHLKKYPGSLHHRRRSRCSDRYGHRMASDHLLSLSVRRRSSDRTDNG